MNTSERTRLAPPGGPLLDTEAAAGYLNVNPRWLERAVAEHRVEVVRIGRKLRFSTTALNELIERGTTPASDLS